MAYQPAWKANGDGSGQFDPVNPSTPLLSSNTSSSAVSILEAPDRGSRFSFSVFNLMNAIIGSGLLGLAYAVAESGIALFIILLTVVVIATLYTVNLLLELCHMTGVMAFEDIGFMALGKPGKVLTAAVIMTQNIGSMSSYLFIIRKELPEVIDSLLHIEREDSWFDNGTFLVLLVMFVIILPLACLPKIGFLGYTSSFSVLSMTFFVIVVVVEKFRIPCPLLYPIGPSANTTDDLGDWSEEAITGGDGANSSYCQAEYISLGLNTAYALPTMMFSFVCHTAVIPIYKELSVPSKPRMLGVSATALLSCYTLYITAGIFGYLTFYDRVESELLLTYSHLLLDPSTLIAAIRLIVLVAIIFHLPVIHFPCRISLLMLLKMILPRMPPTKTYMVGLHIASTLILLTTITIIALVVPDIKQIFGVFGATSSTGLMLFLPSLFYILIAPGPLLSRPKIIPIILFLSSFVILGVCLTAIIYGFIHPGSKL